MPKSMNVCACSYDLHAPESALFKAASALRLQGLKRSCRSRLYHLHFFTICTGVTAGALKSPDKSAAPTWVIISYLFYACEITFLLQALIKA